MRRLVVAEKNIAAAKIAAILSQGKSKREMFGKVPTYCFSYGGDDWIVMGLRGHIVEWDYPKKLASWQKVDPRALVWADPEKRHTQEAIVKVLEAVARDVAEVIVATDYDREGELIGMEAVEIVQRVNPKATVKRARFSAFTSSEVKGAFEATTHMDKALASSAESRQLIDLAWGATLTRLISRAANQVWKDYLSIGRVQSPTLALIAEREKEIEAFKPRAFWNLVATFEKDGTFTGEHEHGRFWNRSEVEAIWRRLEGARSSRVRAFSSSERRDRPPAPFDTTAFLTEATKLGLSPYKAMNVAEELYNGGYISYPRTDNTVYPRSLSLKQILKRLEASDLREDVRRLQGQMRSRPTRGKRQSTDHPPIHPVEAATKAKLKGDKWKVYELVVRRFMATLAPDGLVENREATLEVKGEAFLSSGQRLLEPGWRAYYPYYPFRETHLPSLEEGESVPVLKVELAEGATKPPARYGQGTLIQQMERVGLGTKSTRHEIIQKLFDRGYVQGDPIQPTPSGRSLVDALKDHARDITEPKMTARLEEEMDLIAQGTKGLEEVVAESREMLEESVVTLQEHEEEIGQRIREALQEQRMLGTCVVCGGHLVIRKPRGRRPFVGCDRYPSCTATYNLPRGMVEPAGKECEKCGVPMIKVTFRRGSEERCINETCEVFLQKSRIGICHSCGGNLLVRHSRNGKRFVGCTGYPDCKVTYPLPQRGSLQPLGKSCEVCGSPMIRVFSRRRPWTTCINMECPTKMKPSRESQTPKGT